MKYVKKHIFFIPIALLFVASCSRKLESLDEVGGTAIVCRFHNMAANGENPDIVRTILQQRVEAYINGLEFIGKQYDRHADSCFTHSGLKVGLPTVDYYKDQSNFIIKIPGIECVDAELLFSHGMFSISAVYENEDLLNLLPDKDTLHKNDLQNEERLGAILPADIKIDSFRSFYYLKDSPQNIDVNTVLLKVDIDSGLHMPQIRLDLNDEGKKQLATLTANNIGRHLAIVLDSVIISSPFVNQVIVGGGVTISERDFSNSDIAAFKALLVSGIIKSKVEILHTAVIRVPNKE